MGTLIIILVTTCVMGKSRVFTHGAFYNTPFSFTYRVL